MKPMLVLAIESSCDETAVAILSGSPGEAAVVLASEVASQIELHRVYGGVVPEIASRNHSLHLRPLVEQALRHAGVGIGQIDSFAATSGPGLASSLLVGATAAKAMAVAHKGDVGTIDKQQAVMNHAANAADSEIGHERERQVHA